MEINVIYGLHCAQVCACKINAHKKINDIRLWMGNNIARTCVHISPLSAISFPHFKCFKFKNKNRKTHTHWKSVSSTFPDIKWKLSLFDYYLFDTTKWNYFVDAVRSKTVDIKRCKVESNCKYWRQQQNTIISPSSSSSVFKFVQFSSFYLFDLVPEVIQK